MIDAEIAERTVGQRMVCCFWSEVFFFQAEDGIRDLVRSRGLGDVYKRQGISTPRKPCAPS